MNIQNLNKKLSKILGFKVTIKDYQIIDNDLINVILSINNKTNFTKLIKVLKLLDFVTFNVNVKYQHDIGFFNIDIITFYDVDDVDDVDDINIIINDFFNDIDIIDALNTIDDVDDIDDDLKYVKYNQYKTYDINNNVIDNLTIDDIDDIDILNKKFLPFNKHMIKNMLIKRNLKGLDNLFNKYLTKNGHLKFLKHHHYLRIIKDIIITKSNNNKFKDEYDINDYKYLSYKDDRYFKTYDDDILKSEYNVKISNGFNYNDVEYFKTPKNFKSTQYYINLPK